MPAQSVVDAHLHLWQPSRHDWYPQLADFAAHTGTPSLADDFLLPDYDRAAGATTVTGLVHVSATTARHAYLDETRWVDEVAATAGRPIAIVGAVDPTLDGPDLLRHLDEQARSPRLRGIRVFRGLSPNTPAADTIASWLQERDAVFDLVAHPGDMLDWIDFLVGYPRLRVVLEHLGLPTGTDQAARTAWQNALSLAAKETGWQCKLSGLGMICPDFRWPTLEYWLETSIQLWGWQRLIFGSNMPVDAMAGSYGELLAAVDRAVAADATEQEAELFYGGTAAATYALG
ncbi:amidohydrolase [Nocardia sp. CC227C]|uniref:amidohydrolase family protein n=1 Tax=Nocardia sp. CC227C TaxID=3044562 RepID=UPI00278BD341|nr:amidohydrolase family protein [Nocardia sp. CC227C]